MRRFVLTSVAAVGVVFSIAAAAGASAAAQCGSGVGPIKYSTTETIKGKPVVVNCGPATAKLRYKGKTYSFAPGTCFRYLGSFKLNLGKSLLVPTSGSGGYTNMSLTAASNGQIEVGAAVGKISIYAASKSSGVGAKGTFTSITRGVSFTGSWNCGGPIKPN
jgi:hypothetical protein